MGLCLICFGWVSSYTVNYSLVDETQRRAVNEALHVSTAQTNVVCRENEQNRILDFCKKCIKEEKAGSLYACGCPGTGKTLSMEKVKVMLADWANEVLIPAASKIIFCSGTENLNSMIFTNAIMSMSM